MKNVSTEFKRQLHYGSKKYLSFADITLEDDTVINLTNAEIFMGGFSCEQAISSDNTFSALGSVIIGSASLIINNISGAYTQYDFTNATVVMQVGLTVNGVVEKVRLGTYRVDDAVYTESSIKLSMLDYMEQFDRPYTTNIQYPTTLNTILRDICTQCGVALATPDFPHKSFSVSTMPLDNGTTFREVVSWIASIAGCYAFCNDSGQLVLDWFDTSVLNQSIDLTVPQPDVNNLGYHYIHNLKSVQTIGIDDTVITGVSISVENENDPAELGIFENNEGTHAVTLNVQDNVTTYTVGTEGYIIHIEGNDFITHSNVIEIINWLATQLIGLQFRKLSVQILSNPTIEVGDVAKVVDRKGNTYNSLITRSYFSVGSYQDIVCGADTPLKNSATRYSSATKSFLKSKKLLKSEQTLREQQIENLTNQLAVKSGMYTTIEASSGGGNIYYMHNKPTLAESSVVWKMTTSAWGVTTDYDHENPEDTVWNGGMTVDGDTITRILSAVGVNADWIETGEFLVTDSHGNETFYVNCDTGVVRINATSFSLTGSTIQQIAQEAIDNIDQTTIFDKLTDDGQGGHLEGIFMEGNDLYINASYIKSGTLILGGSNNVRGTLKVLAENGSTEYVKLNYNGITAIKGEIGGWEINDHSIKRDKSDSTGSNKINTLIQCPSGSTSTVLAIGATWNPTGGPNGTGATDWTTAPFRVTALGKMYATGAEISGKITATSGKIGNWDIKGNSIRRESSDSVGTNKINTLIQCPSGSTSTVLAIGATWNPTGGSDGTGATDWTTAPFRVTALGTLYAKAGYIADWEIKNSSLRRELKDGYDVIFQSPSSATSTVLSIGAPTVSNSVKWAQSPFYVKGNGKLFTSGASINGTFESKTGNQSVKIVNGIIYGYYGSTKAGEIDMSAGYTDTERIVSVRGENRLHLQGGTEIWFEIGGAAMHFTSRSLSVSNKIEGELHDDRGFSGIGYLPTGFYDDGTASGWVEVVIKDGIVR